ncbi:MAG TPA: hypothetical protein VGF55_18575 [Gemmataceae bacterium]
MTPYGTEPCLLGQVFRGRPGLRAFDAWEDGTDTTVHHPVTS